MPILTVEEVKLHLRIDSDDEDTLLENLIGVAKEQAEAYINRAIFSTQQEMEAAQDEGGIVANLSVRAAMCLIVGELYQQREDIARPGENDVISKISRRLLDPFRTGQGV